MISRAQIFPTIIIILNLGAGFMYCLEGDVRKIMYWFAAAVLNIAVTF
jgi:hypothetical protein